MIVEVDPTCRIYDIGHAGFGDRLASYENRTGTTVGLYDWRGFWYPLAKVANDQRGNLPPEATNKTDAVKLCD